jgi:hypothetical protein
MHRFLRPLVVSSVLAGAVLMGQAVNTAGVQADPKVPDVPAHRHWQLTGNGTWAEVGPRVCDNPNVQAGFNQFHVNVHLGTPNTFAFDHPHNPVDLVARGCTAGPPAPPA